LLSFFTYIVVGLIGLMMGTVYKRSFSNLEILRVNPYKIARLYTVLTVIGVSFCLYLSYKSIHAFSEIGMAEDKAHIFEDYQNMLVYFLNLGFILMIVLANLHSMASKKITWALYFFTFGVYASFAVIDNFFLEDTFFHFKKMNQLWQGEFSFASLLGYSSLFISALLVAFNAYMTSWGLKK
jgi:hypothetical protein